MTFLDVVAFLATVWDPSSVSCALLLLNDFFSIFYIFYFQSFYCEVPSHINRKDGGYSSVIQLAKASKMEGS